MGMNKEFALLKLMSYLFRLGTEKSLEKELKCCWKNEELEELFNQLGDLLQQAERDRMLKDTPSPNLVEDREYKFRLKEGVYLLKYRNHIELMNTEI